jgi:hypothetical protein
MGAKHSQSVKDTSSVIATAITSTNARCFSYADAGNTISVDGDDDDVSGNVQKVTVTVSSACDATSMTQDSINASIANAVSQALGDKSVALTQWADTSRDSTRDTVTNTIESQLSSTTVANCLQDLNAKNVIGVSGSGDVVADNNQTATASAVQSCAAGASAINAAAAGINNSANQHLSADSENPLAFIGDAIQAVLGDTLVAVAGVFILLICFVGLIMVLHRRGRPAGADRHEGAGAGAGAPPGAGAWAPPPGYTFTPAAAPN